MKIILHMAERPTMKEMKINERKIIIKATK